MPATFPIAVPAAPSHAAQDYRRHGWTVTETSDGIHLVTDERVAAVELTGTLAAAVRRFLRANNLSGPVIEIPGVQRREIHLVVGAAKAARAIDMLRNAGATVYTDGAPLPLPPSVNSPAWGISPTEARWVPPLVAISAAVSAATARGSAHLRKVAC